MVIEHSYCMPPEKEKENIETPQNTQTLLTHDHIYTNKEETPKIAEQKPPKPPEKPPRQRKQKHNHRKLQELQNLDRLAAKAAAPPPDVRFTQRDMAAEMGVLYDFLTRGIDQEDIAYVRQSYEAMLADDTIGYWLNDTHWVDHCVTDWYSCPPKRRKRDDVRVHATGCARTEGYYKLEANEKAKYKYHHTKGNINASPENLVIAKTQGE